MGAFRSFLLFVVLVGSGFALADHELTEPSDGTVNSFIAVNPPRVVEPIGLTLENRTALDLSHFRGKLVLLNLWATWCPPCIRELPALDRLQKRMGSERFEVVTVAVDRAGYAAARQFFDELSIESLKLYTSTAAEFGRAFPIDVFPASFFIDPQGRVISFMRAYADWDDPQADALVKRYLSESEF